QNSAEAKQEAAQQVHSITMLCEQLQFALEPIDWQQWGWQAPVKVNGVEIASLLDLSQRERDDFLRLTQIKLFEHAALEAIPASSATKACMWSPVNVVQPQDFLSLWVITLETEERIPIVESIEHGQRVYDFYRFDATDQHQLIALFGALSQGAYHLGEVVTIRERAQLYTGVILHILPPDNDIPQRKPLSRGYHTIAGTAYTNENAARYLVDCSDGFPHLVKQSQIVPQT
ncbi:MAG TPA: hypothetical protein VFN35_24840, partial [Ktedonobacteraceae bacterium]|nr:hypothetical protein [Ktedonobacteraceae bacterium]